jgi:uncharacterized tellurite resistance protein B-like protein
VGCATVPKVLVAGPCLSRDHRMRALRWISQGEQVMQKNRPEDVARVVAMTMLADGEIQDVELDRLEELDAFTVMGLSREGFADVVQDYLGELVDGADADGHVHPLAPALVDGLVAAIDDPALRLTTAQLMLAIANADNDLSEGELAVFRHVLGRWGLDLESLRGSCA